MKETENLIFSGVRLIFISLMNTKSGIFTRGFATRENSFWCSFDEIKIDLTQKKSNILYEFKGFEQYAFLSLTSIVDKKVIKYSLTTEQSG